MVNGGAIERKPGIKRLGVRRWLLVATLVTSGVVSASIPANARPQRETNKTSVKTPLPVVDDETLSPQQVDAQVKAAAKLRAELTRSGGQVAAANARLERLSAQANTLLAKLSLARETQVTAETEATTQRNRLVVLGKQVQRTQDALGHLASGSYIHGGGPMGDMAAILEAITAPSPDQNTDSLATVQYIVTSRARLLIQLRSMREAQVTTTAKAAAASARATAGAKAAAAAKTALDKVIVDQRAALEGFQSAEAAQVLRAAKVRGKLLGSQSPLARAADRKLARVLEGQDYVVVVDQGSTCGKGVATYPNGRWPASALCSLYAASDESLRRTAAVAFNAMSVAYQRHSGSPLCVTDGYRSYAEQVAVKKARPGLAATPGKSKHGLGLALDLCGGVQSFGSPAHLWMKRNGPLYGWFHPAWAEPSGVLPEPWHWEFAN